MSQIVAGLCQIGPDRARLSQVCARLSQIEADWGRLSQIEPDWARLWQVCGRFVPDWARLGQIEPDCVKRVFFRLRMRKCNTFFNKYLFIEYCKGCHGNLYKRDRLNGVKMLPHIDLYIACGDIEIILLIMVNCGKLWYTFRLLSWHIYRKPGVTMSSNCGDAKGGLVTKEGCTVKYENTPKNHENRH